MTDDFVTYLRALAEKHPRTVRSAARMRQPLDGAEAQALEGALCATERERDEARAEIERLREIISTLEIVGKAADDERARMQKEIERLHKAHETACLGGELLRGEVERLREALLWYADHRNHFPVLHHRAGYPDPVAVFVEEPPIMTDGGRRAREAMEAKP